ncbi:MAG: c-type cytochrome [Pacificimonas sp.]|jgi:cytochrome c|nr:c-type cytochrome [Pacificimonas sp.]
MLKTMAIMAAAAAAFLAGHAPALSQDDMAELFARQCATCHGDPNVEGSLSRLGPHLVDLEGRLAGDTDYRRYSPGLKSSGVVWNTETLDAYLLNPRATIRGTMMAYPGLRDGEDRARLVAYILGDTE